MKQKNRDALSSAVLLKYNQLQELNAFWNYVAKETHYDQLYSLLDFVVENSNQEKYFNSLNEVEGASCLKSMLNKDLNGSSSKNHSKSLPIMVDLMFATCTKTVNITRQS